MSKFPPPPGVAALGAVPPAEHVLPAGTLLWRIYAAGGAHPARWDEFRAFGPLTTMRFDHHTPPRRLQGRAILYGATGIGTCVAEVFQATRSIVALARRLPRRYDVAVRARGDRAAWDLGVVGPRSQAFLWR